jgi:broad specificity phosphatase PhoE
LKQLFFIRHGQTEWNAIARMQGQWNSDLSDLGRSQADINGRMLAGFGIQTLFASPLDRTRQTTEIVNRHLGVPVEFDDRLKEWDCGDWSGHLYTEVKTNWATEWAALEADRFHYRGPNCENYPDMIRRSTPFLGEIRSHPAERIGIVSHGMIGRVMVSTLLGFDEAQTLSFHQGNDVVLRVTLGDELAAVDHYVGGEGPFKGLHQAND